MTWGTQIPGVPAGPGGPARGRVNATHRPLVRRWLQYGAMAIGFGLCAITLAGAIGLDTGVQAALLGLLFAVLPLGVVVPAFLWLDRFEAEPARMLLFTFAWGALVASVGSLVLNTFSMGVLREIGQDPITLGSVVVAPVVEETSKGLAVLIIALWRRSHFDGIVDGMVYAGITAAGFAFAENILYLGRAFQEGGTATLASVFVMRGIFSPFAHPLFTICTGIGLGVAATTGWTATRLLAPALGLLMAMSLHALWNLSAVAGGSGFVLAYVCLQLPIFAGFLWLATWARRREGHLIGQHLRPYADAGWLSYPEVEMLSSMAERRRARVWARFHGGRRALAAMEAFQDAASDLAYLRMRIARGVADDSAPLTEHILLGSIMTRRLDFVGTEVL